MNAHIQEDKLRFERLITLKQNQAFLEGRFSLFHTQFIESMFKNGSDPTKLESIFELVNGWDEYCHLPYDFGKYLDDLVNDPTILVGVHRTTINFNGKNDNPPQSDRITSIMTTGLENPGHTNNIIGFGISNEIPELTTVITPLEGLTGYINLVAPYKHNNAIVLTAFPKTLVNEEAHITNSDNFSQVYDLSATVPKIKPEYMLGIIVKNDSGLDAFYPKDTLIDNKLHK